MGMVKSMRSPCIDRSIVRMLQTVCSIKFTLLAMLLLTIAAPIQAAPSQPPPVSSQYDVQAVYLFDFAKFVRWPVGAEQETLNFCIAGKKVYADTLTKIVAGEQIDSHPLAVRLVEHPEDEAGCDILFIDATAQEPLDSLLAAALGKPILTVSDMPGFLDQGGMIQFLLIDNRVRFSVDLRPVGRSGLSLNSELLKVAVKVNGTTAGGGAP
jgi:hypothetical protein